MKCDLLVINTNTTPCNNSDCALCSILRKSFLLSKAGTHVNFLRFGPGIYFTATSSKSHDYNSGSERQYNGHKYRVVLLCKVVLGRVYKIFNGNCFTAPPTGFDSVVGEPGTELNYDECIVYDERACKVAYIIVYRLN
jgi:hypothetical protein